MSIHRRFCGKVGESLTGLSGSFREKRTDSADTRIDIPDGEGFALTVHAKHSGIVCVDIITRGQVTPPRSGSMLMTRRLTACLFMFEFCSLTRITIRVLGVVSEFMH